MQLVSILKVIDERLEKLKINEVKKEKDKR